MRYANLTVYILCTGNPLGKKTRATVFAAVWFMALSTDQMQLLPLVTSTIRLVRSSTFCPRGLTYAFEIRHQIL